MTIDAAGRRLFVAAIVATTLLSVSGCGLKGDLYLPGEQPEPQSSPVPAAEQSGSAPANQGDDQTDNPTDDPTDDESAAPGTPPQD